MKKPIKKRPTLRLSIIASLVILISASNLSIIGLIFFYSQRLFTELIDKSMDRVEDRIVKKSDNYFKPSIKDISYYQNLLQNRIVKIGDFKKLETIIYQTLKNSDTLEMINLGLEDGSFLMLKKKPNGAIDTKIIKYDHTAQQKHIKLWHHRNPGKTEIIKKENIPKDTYDPRKRPWYKGAKRTNSLFWTNIYIFWSDKKPGITVSLPVKIDKQLMGVISADIGLGLLSDFLSSLYVSKNGKAVIISNKNTLIASPWGISTKKDKKTNKLKLKYLQDYSKPILQKLRGFNKKEINKNIDDKFNFEGDKYSLRIIPLNFPPGKNWRVAIYIPAKDFLSHFKSITYKALWFVLIIFIFALLAGIFVAHLMTKPLHYLIKEVEQLQKFQFHTEPEKVFAPFEEINEVLSSFENMKRGLRALQKYVPSDLVKVLLKMNKDVALGGETKDITILFTDIEGFTSVSENMDPMELTKYLGEYLDVISTIIRKNHGTVDKYIGDAVMAFWGAPLDINNEELYACESAVQCLKDIRELDEKNPQRPPFNTRFGIDCGKVVVGNIGSTERFNYTIMGDHVNTASRLEGINKVYGTNIIISEPVYQKVKQIMVTRKLDYVAVKGKTRPVLIYELIDNKNNIEDDSIFESIDIYEKGFDFYVKREFSKALKIFSEGKNKFPTFKPFQVFKNRCEIFIENPPPENWGGEWIMKTK